MPTPYLFMKLVAGGKPIEGEATEQFFEKQIALESVSWQMKSEHEATEDRSDTKKVKTTNKPRRIQVTKVFDRSTINLCNFLSKRTAFEKATITLLKGSAWDEKPRPHVEIELSMGYVESVSLTAAESDKVVGVEETVTLSYRRIKLLYHPTRERGLSGNNAATTFDLSLPSVDG